jgi:hypothetical protein
MLVDYVHKRKFPVLGPVATWTLRTATVGVLVGVYQFNTNDIGTLSLRSALCHDNELPSYIGLTELIAKVWAA